MNSTYDKTERKIIEATLKTLNENGLASTTSLKIAENAGVSEVTVFRRFQSKENLLKITKDYYLDYVLKEIDSAFTYDDEVDFELLLKEIWWNILNFFEDNLNIFKVAIEGTFSRKDNEMIKRVSDKILAKLIVLFENGMKSGKIRKINPKVAALNVYSVIFQSIILWRIYGGEPIDNIDEILDDFLDIFFKGLDN